MAVLPTTIDGVRHHERASAWWAAGAFVATLVLLTAVLTAPPGWLAAALLVGALTFGLICLRCMVNALWDARELREAAEHADYVATVLARHPSAAQDRS